MSEVQADPSPRACCAQGIVVWVGMGSKGHFCRGQGHLPADQAAQSLIQSLWDVPRDQSIYTLWAMWCYTIFT